MYSASVINSALYYSGRLQKKFPVNHDLLPNSPDIKPLAVNCKKYLFRPPMEKSDDVMVNLERNHVHYGFAYHSLVKAARTASWNGMKSAWKRDGKTHTPQEITELETAINGFTALLIRPFFLECVPYNVKELRQYMLDGHVPEEELVKLMNPPGASPRFIMRITNFFEYFQSVMTSMHNEWNQRISSAAPEKAASQEFQTFSHALGALDTIFDLYFEE